jgi:CheY-like chemotaxis protein
MPNGGLTYEAEPRPLGLARVLLVHGELAQRLTLQTILQAGGYTVDAAATPSEALAKLDESQYDLVLSDTTADSRAACRRLLAYARIKDYHPATALITSSQAESRQSMPQRGHEFSIHAENLPALLGEIAELIGARAIRRARPLRQAV